MEVAADGPSALLAVQANPPDVVLLDHRLPKLDGWMVAKEIRPMHGKRPAARSAHTACGFWSTNERFSKICLLGSESSGALRAVLKAALKRFEA